MKHTFVKPTILGLFLLAILISCDGWVLEGSNTIEHAEYTGKNTARVIYKSTDWKIPLYADIYNKEGIKKYRIIEESSHQVYGRSQYYVDITVEPNWEPGDNIRVSGKRDFWGNAYFDVPNEGG